MNLEISAIRDAGSDVNERVVFRVKADCDIGGYFTFISQYINVEAKRVSTVVVAPYWFPDAMVRTNDYVVVYTKAGVNSTKKNDDGTTSYFFYRGLPHAVCTDNRSCAVLLSVAQWGSKGIEQNK